MHHLVISSQHFEGMQSSSARFRNLQICIYFLNILNAQIFMTFTFYVYDALSVSLPEIFVKVLFSLAESEK